MGLKDCEFDIAMVSFGWHEIINEDLTIRMVEEMGGVLKGLRGLNVPNCENEKGFQETRISGLPRSLLGGTDVKVLGV